MIFTILLWMGMTGWHQCYGQYRWMPELHRCVQYAVNIAADHKTRLLLEPNVIRNIWLDSGERRYSDDRNSSDAPADHVFEIRTKRKELKRVCLTVQNSDGTHITDIPCQQVTRELWMDGHKLGTLKYTNK